MLTVRLSAQTEAALEAFCQQKSLSKSQVVKEALALYMKDDPVTMSSYELGADLFGQEGSGQTDRSTTYKRRLKERLREKHTH